MYRNTLIVVNTHFPDATRLNKNDSPELTA